jgi:hypothetical protein
MEMREGHITGREICPIMIEDRKDKTRPIIRV